MKRCESTGETTGRNGFRIVNVGLQVVPAVAVPF